MPENKPRVFLLILDGYGLREEAVGNGAKLARTPLLHSMASRWGSTALSASGRDVGLPAGQMGNSEVGHLNLGAGRVVYQEITRIDRSIETREFFDKPALIDAADYASRQGVAWHLMGLVSDGGVHSSMEHLYALLEFAKRRSIHPVFIHAFMDGRDTPPQSGITYIRQLQDKIREIGVGKIATVTGRYWAMDRDKRWDRVERAYKALVYGEGMPFASAEEAVEDSYRRGVTDEFIEPSIIMKGDKPTVRMRYGGGMMFFNFRADRARELTRALADPSFKEFVRKPLDPHYTTMTRYSEEFNYPVVFPPRALDKILTQILAENGLKQFRIAETEKYAHVTYFFNGGVEEPSPGEHRALIASPKVATYDLQPEMSAADVASRALEAFDEDFSFILLNFANPDMVGHTGSIEAIVRALEALDPLVEQLIRKAQSNGFTTLVTSDHGNCEMMIDENGGPHTAHTTNLVPFVVVPPDDGMIALRQGGVLADVAPTILHLLGLQQPREMEGRNLFVA